MDDQSSEQSSSMDYDDNLNPEPSSLQSQSSITSSSSSSIISGTMPMVLNINIDDDFIAMGEHSQSTGGQWSSSSISTTKDYRQNPMSTSNIGCGKMMPGGISSINNNSQFAVQQETIQKKAFTKWLNSHLSKKGHPCISDLFTDLRDGTILVALLDVLCGCKIKLERGNFRVHHINNVARALQVFSEKCQIKLVNISTNDIVDGNHKITLGLVWCIILHWQVNNIFRNSGPGQFVVSPKTTTTSNIPQLSSSTSASKLPVIGINQIPDTSCISQNKTTIRPLYTKLITNNRINVPLKPNDFNLTTNSSQQQQLTTMSQNDLEKTLLAWCRKSTENYEGVQINNFTSSWNDGLAFNALIHHFRPKLFSYGEILSMSPEERLKHAFDVAAKHLKIDKLLDPEDVNQPRPDKKSVMMYVLCFFQVFESSTKQSSESEQQKYSSPQRTSSKQEQSTGLMTPTPIRSDNKQSGQQQVNPLKIMMTQFQSTTSSNPQQQSLTSPQPSKKLKPSPSNRPSNIPVLSSKFSQAQQNNNASGGNSGSTKMIDSQLLDEYSSTIQDIMTWLFAAEDELKLKEQNDHQHFRAKNFESLSTKKPQSTLTMIESSPDFNQLLHNRIMSTIEAAEYAKLRFVEHEQFMRQLSEYSDKISNTFEKGKRLIDSCGSGQLGTSTNLLSLIEASLESMDDSPSQIELTIQIHANLLNQRFNKLRLLAIKRQRYLQDMLVQAQNAQLDELRILMTKTEQRISLLIPEKFDQIPFSFQSLQEQLKQIKELQETMNSEQQLLSAISKFVIVDQDDQQKEQSEINFVDQLEALNERWANICQITENRRNFLKKLNECWSSFNDEKNRLNEWFQRLERRLTDIEETADEILAKSESTKQDLKFLKDMSIRLERMRTDILYGPERSQKLHLKKENDIDDDELKVSPMSKITRLSHALIQLDSSRDSKLCQKVIQNIEDIRLRWEILAGQIETIENAIQERMKKFPKSVLDEIETQSTSPIPKEIESLNIPELTLVSKCKKMITENDNDGGHPNVNDEWQFDLFLKWIDTNEKSLMQLSISEDLFDFHSQTNNKWIDFETPNSIEKCFQTYDELNFDKTDDQDKKHHPILINLLKLDSGNIVFGGAPLPCSLEYEDRVLSQIEEEIHKQRSHDFDQLVIKSKKIIEDFKSENENHETIEKFMNLLTDRWETFQKIIHQLRLHLQVDSLLQVMHFETIQMVDALGKYKKNFKKFHDELNEMTIKDNQMLQQVEMCFIYIRGKMDKVKEYNDKLYKFYLEIPRLFVFWPELDTNNVEHRDLPWKQVDETSEPFVAIQNGQKIRLSSFQSRCLHLTGELLRFNQTMIIMAKMAELLKTEILIQQENIQPSKEIAKLKMKFKRCSPPLERQSSNCSEKSIQSTNSSKADKILIAIEEFNHWLEKVIGLVDGYDDDDFEDGDQDDNQSVPQNQAEQPKSLGDHPPIQKVKTCDSDSSNHQRVPGSKLCSFSDLANAIDHRIIILADLQKTLDDERPNYNFACKSAAGFIFDQSQEKNLPEIEQELLALNPDNYDDEQTIQLVNSVQSLIQRWGLLFEKLANVLSQLEDISPSITVLETEFSQLLKFVDSSDEFLDEPIAIGDNESLTCQLAECVRLKDYMQGTAEENFQTIIDTAQKALKLLFGKENEVFTYDVIPVIKYIKETWLSLCDRILNKLERLQYAQRMTIDLNTSLEDYKTRLNEFEKQIQPQSMEKCFQINKKPPQTVEILEIFNLRIYNLPDVLQKQFLDCKSKYEREINGNNDECLIAEMLSFISTNSNTLAFEQLKEIANEKLPKRFDHLEQQFKYHCSIFDRLMKIFEQQEQSLKNEYQFSKSRWVEFENIRTKIKTIQDVEDCVQLLDQVECFLSYSTINDRIQLFDPNEKKNDPLIDYVRNIPTVFSLFDKYQEQYKQISELDNKFLVSVEQFIKLLEKFIEDYKEFDLMIAKKQKCFNEYKLQIDQYKDSSTKIQDLIKQLKYASKEVTEKSSLYSSKFKVLEFEEAAKRIEDKSKFIMRMFDDLIEFVSKQESTNQNKTETKIKIDDEIAILEKELADFGVRINELEISINENENEQTILRLLERLIMDYCKDYENQLNTFENRFDCIRKISKLTTLNPTQESRLQYLEMTRNALNSSLNIRKSVLEELVKHCEDINKSLMNLEEEANKIEQQNQEQTPELMEVKQNCRSLFTEVCSIKERLDISCIRNSDLIIGIEEVGAYYDELITLVAEHYFLDEEDDDDNDGRLSDNVPDNQLEQMDITSKVIESTDKLSIVSQSQIKPILEESTFKSDPTIQITTTPNQNDNIQIENIELSTKLSATTKLLLTQTRPTSKRTSQEIVDKEHEDSLNSVDDKTKETLSIPTAEKIAKISPAQSIYKPLSQQKNLLLFLSNYGKHQMVNACSSYTFQSYLLTLNLLSANMERIAQRQIPELVHRRQFNKENKMFPFMLEDELYILNKSLNGVRIHLEQILCTSILFDIKPMNQPLKQCEQHDGFKMEPETSQQQYDQVKIFHPPNIADDGQMITLNSLTDDWHLENKQPIDWNRCHCQVIYLLECLETKFQHSNGVFLTLHRHLKLIHEDTIQFNMEIRKLLDWYENVELQINNGRVTLISADPNRLDETDLNLHVVARTQSLLVTQLRTHIPIYGSLRVIYEKILNHFSPELNEKFREYSFDFKALVEAKNRIKLEMKRVTRKWNSIVHELTWRRQCLIDLAVCKPTATVNGQPYRQGMDQDFDALIRESVQNEFEEYRETFALEQLEQWIEKTKNKVIEIREQTILRDDDHDSARNLYKKLLSIEQELAKQFMNWMLMTQEPFVRLLNVGKIPETERDMLNNRFQKISVTVYQLTYFLNLFITTCSNVGHLIKNEFEWLLLAHEHLNAIDDYLGQQTPFKQTINNVSLLSMAANNQKTKDRAMIQPFPNDSLNFMENIKNTLINHERSIKQISILFDELSNNSKQFELRYEISKLSDQFDKVKQLHSNLIERLRRHGLTVWSSLHYLFKNVFTYYHSYRERLQQQQTQPQTKTGSMDSNRILKQSVSKRSRFHQQKQQPPPTQQSWEYNRDELTGYYQLATIELNRWLAFETFMISLFIKKSMKISSMEISTESTPSTVYVAFPTSSTIIKPSHLLKYTIRRCQDFLTELNFSVTILEQIWLQLSLEIDGAEQDNQITSKDVDGGGENLPSTTTTNLEQKHLNRTQSNNISIPAAIQKNPCSTSSAPKPCSKDINGTCNNCKLKTPTKATISELDIEDLFTKFEPQKPKLDNKLDNKLDSRTSICKPDFQRYQTLRKEIMERMRDLQREHHQRSLQHLLQLKQQMQQQQQQPPPLPAPRAQQQIMSPMKRMIAQQNNHHSDNVYDTVADALVGDNVQSTTNTQNHDHYYYRPPDLPEIQNNSNLDMQRQDIEQWLDSMEQRLSRISIQQHKQSQVNNQNNQEHNTEQSRNQETTTNNKQYDQFGSGALMDIKELKSHLDLLSEYEAECNQYSSRLQSLSNSIDARIASLTPLNQNVMTTKTSTSSTTSVDNHQKNQSNNSTISMPYYDHLMKLRKQATEMQCRSNYLFLCINCKTRSLNELLTLTSSSSNRNLIMSMVNGSVSGTDLDCYGNQSPKKSSKSLISSTSSPVAALKSQQTASSSGSSSNTGVVASSVTGSPIMAIGRTDSSGQIQTNSGGSSSNASGGQSVNNTQNYSFHEQSEKRFNKWLNEMEQSLDFIEKGLAAESALINNDDGSITNFNCNDGALYSNVSEMQQMHMNYYEKIKIIQREIEQKRADHRLLMELIENDVNTQTSATTTSDGKSDPSSPYRTREQTSKYSKDPWLNRYRLRVESLNDRWNSVRLRVLTLRSRLESSSFVSKNTTTTCPAMSASHSTSLYSVNSGIGGGREVDIETSSLVSMNAFQAVVAERSSQLILSLRELTEWIIKRQIEFQQKQMVMQMPDENGRLTNIQPQPQNMSLDIANVLQQKSSLIQLRNQLIEKRPIIDSSVLACHNFLRRLGVKRVQDAQYAKLSAKLSQSASMVSSLANWVISEAPSQPTTINQEKRFKQKQTELEKVEQTLNREMNKLLELWHSIQTTVDLGLQRLDEAHLRLADLQRVMEELCLKLHEAEMVKSKWTPIANVTFDELSQQRLQLKIYNQNYVAPVSRDVIHVNEIAARLTGRNVPLSHANLKSLEEVTTRARLLRVSVDERARELDQVVHDHGTAQQHFLTEAVEEPWERAVTQNKLPCYINRKTETVHYLSPKYMEIMQSMNDYNFVRYAAYRTAMKLRHLQVKLGLDNVTLEILMEAFQQHGLGPNVLASKKNSNEANANKFNDKQQNDQRAISEDLPYELRLIGVSDIVSCLKTIFEMAESEQQKQQQIEIESLKKKNKQSNKTNGNEQKNNSQPGTPNGSSSSSQPQSNNNNTINVPLSVDLCLNWLLDLYDAPSRAGFIRQFSFQVALVLLSRISWEQKYIYLFNLIADEKQQTDERHFGLLIYDCLRLPKLLGEVAAFGGTNVEPSVRSCMEMSGCQTSGVITVGNVLKWIRAEPQSLVWLVVMHRLRLADRSRHPVKCNSCHLYPIVGFRYRCLKCFNFDLCQYCFLSDKTVKKHKPSHPMKEYCVATTSGEDMKDFTKILRNKFKSERYFKRHHQLGYLPVQSLHEGDRFEESAPSFVHTLQGSYSHAPSSNTTPVHTLSYHPQRAVSPGSLTQRDLELIADSRFVANNHRSLMAAGAAGTVHDGSVSPTGSMGIYGTRNIQQGRKFQTSVEHHLQTGSTGSPLMIPRSLSQSRSGVVASGPDPINNSDSDNANVSRSSLLAHQLVNKSIDEMHHRLGKYAHRLAGVESSMLNRSQSLRGSSHSSTHRSRSGTKFDSLPQQEQYQQDQIHHHRDHYRRSSLGHPVRHQHHDDIVQSPTEMLSKIAADQRTEMEIIIQRLQEENRLLMTEYSQLKNDKSAKSSSLNKSPTVSEDQKSKSKTPINLESAATSNPPMKQQPKSSSTESSTSSANESSDSKKVNNWETSKQTSSSATSSKSSSRGSHVVVVQIKQSTDSPVEQTVRQSLTNGSISSPSHSDSNTSQNSQKQTQSINDNKEHSTGEEKPSEIPFFYWEEARRLRDSKNQLETRKTELEKSNKILESQLIQFKQYMANTGSMDQETKQKLENRIQEAEKLLNMEKQGDCSKPKHKRKIEINFGGEDDDDNDVDDKSESEISDSKQKTRYNKTGNNSGTTSMTYHQPLLHTAAVGVNNAVERLVDAFSNPPEDDDNDNDDEQKLSVQPKPRGKAKTKTVISHV